MKHEVSFHVLGTLPLNISLSGKYKAWVPLFLCQASVKIRIGDSNMIVFSFSIDVDLIFMFCLCFSHFMYWEILVAFVIQPSVSQDRGHFCLYTLVRESCAGFVYDQCVLYD